MKILKTVRIIVSLVFFVLICLLFTGIGNFLPNALTRFVLYLQFFPSFLQFLTVAGLASSGFLLVLAVTAITGRIYCSTVCPLGTFMDLVIRARKFLKKRFSYSKEDLFSSLYSKDPVLKLTSRQNFRFIKKTRIVRYVFLLFAIIMTFLNVSLFIGFLDPFSLFGKLFVSLFRPLFLVGNNVIGVIIELSEGTAIGQRVVGLSSPLLVLVSLILISGVILLTWFRNRWYCNTICPVGTTLGLVSGKALVKLRIEPQLCTGCGKCVAACKAACIDPEYYRIDYSNCVVCYNCLAVCEDDAVRFSIFSSLVKVNENMTGFNRPVHNEKSKVKESVTRRKFLGQAISAMSILGGLAALRTSGGNLQYTQNDEPGVSHEEFSGYFPVLTPGTPPGSVGLEHFTASCTACHLCISVCPTEVLQPALLEYGLSGIFQPRMDFHSGFCHQDCFRCSEVCPTGAIIRQTAEEKKTIKTGTAVFVKNLCIVVAQQRPCGLCAARCPTRAISLVSYRGNHLLPVVDDKKCIGCGACEFVCPVRPDRAIVVEALAIHQKVVQDI